MINFELLLQTLDFKKCDQLTDQPTDRTESRDAIASKNLNLYILFTVYSLVYPIVYPIVYCIQSNLMMSNGMLDLKMILPFDNGQTDIHQQLLF